MSSSSASAAAAAAAADGGGGDGDESRVNNNKKVVETGTAKTLRKRHRRPTATTTATTTTVPAAASTSQTTNNTNTNRLRMVQQMKERSVLEQQHKLAVKQCQQNSATIFSTRYLRIAGFFLSCALLFVGYYYLWNIQSRKQRRQRQRQQQQQQQHDIEQDVDNNILLPPVLRHVVMLFPHGIIVREKLPPFLGGNTKYAIATPDNLEARRTLRQFTRKRRFLISNNAAAANNARRDRVNLYGWEKRDFEHQIRQFQWHIVENNIDKKKKNEEDDDETNTNDTNNNSNNNNMDGICGSNFAKSYRKSKSRGLSQIQHDLIVWCLLANGVHDGYVHWNIENHEHEHEHHYGYDNHDDGDDTTTGLLLLQPGYKGVVVQYYNQTKYDSQSIMLLPLSLKQKNKNGPPPPDYKLRGDTSSGSSDEEKAESESDESLDVGHIPRHVLNWIVRGDVWRRESNLNAEQYKHALDELLYSQVQQLMTDQNNNGAEANRWVVLQSLCRSQMMTMTKEAAAGADDRDETDDSYYYQLLVDELDTKYRRVAVSGCTATTSTTATSSESETDTTTTSCDCILYHPHLKPPIQRRQYERRTIIQQRDDSSDE